MFGRVGVLLHEGSEFGSRQLFLQLLSHLRFLEDVSFEKQPITDAHRDAVTLSFQHTGTQQLQLLHFCVVNTKFLAPPLLLSKMFTIVRVVRGWRHLSQAASGTVSSTIVPRTREKSHQAANLRPSSQGSLQEGAFSLVPSKSEKLRRISSLCIRY